MCSVSQDNSQLSIMNTHMVEVKLLRNSHSDRHFIDSRFTDSRFGSRKLSTLRHAGQLILVLMLALVTAACTSPMEPIEIPERAPAPTFTPTTPAPVVDAPVVDAPVVDAPVVDAPQPEASESEPEQPAVEEEPTATPEPRNAQVIVNTQLLNVRGGPGTNYPTVGIVDQGERFDVTGKNGAGDWWEIEYNGGRAWVFNSLVVTENTESVSIAALIPPAPQPTAAPIVIVQPTAVPFVPPPTATLTQAQAAYYAAIAAGQNPNPNPPAQQPVVQPVAPVPVAPPPTAVPVEPTAVPAPAEPSFPFQLLEGVEKCEPNAGITYFEGFVRYKSNDPRNAVCVHIGFFGPRTTKCSGCDGVGAGKWGFSPFGGPAPAGTSVEIFVVGCPSDLPAGGQNSGFSDLTPRSKKWTRTINSSEQCTGITFIGDE